jgi:hypothetical protein
MGRGKIYAKFWPENLRGRGHSVYLGVDGRTIILGYIQKFPDWPPEARTANGTALCH